MRKSTSYPNVVNAYALAERSQWGAGAQIDGRWVPARAAGYPSFWSALQAAWMVFRGEADALRLAGTARRIEAAQDASKSGRR